MRSDERGFTLLELLGVIAIIGVLAAVAIPGMLSQRTKAYRDAMAVDLHSLATSEIAFNTTNGAFTTDLALLATEGYRASDDVEARVSVVGQAFVACTKHPGVPEWLVFDSATSQLSDAALPCA